jgi:hypothetical protein
LSLGTTAIKLGFSVAGDDLGLATHLVREELQDEVNDALTARPLDEEDSRE